MPQDRTAVSGIPTGNGRATPQDRVQRGLLLDFYGELLSARQRECCELYYDEDLSLSEIAETCGISRQGAWDNIRRGTEALEKTEKKTRLLHRHAETVKRLKSLEDLLRRLEERCKENGEEAVLAHEAYDQVHALLRTED